MSDVADGWARNSRDGRVFYVARQGEAFHAFSSRFAATSGLQIHCRSHADICSHFIFLLDGHFKTFWTVPGTFPSTPIPEFYFRFNTGDRKWNGNKSVSLAPAIISLQSRLRAYSHDFAPMVSKMAAKTTSCSGFDRKFGLVAPSFFI